MSETLYVMPEHQRKKITSVILKLNMVHTSDMLGKGYMIEELRNIRDEVYKDPPPYTSR